MHGHMVWQAVHISHLAGKKPDLHYEGAHHGLGGLCSASAPGLGDELPDEHRSLKVLERAVSRSLSPV